MMDLDNITPPMDDTKRKYDPSAYAPFGEQADYAFNQGWMPIQSAGGATIYRNRYQPAFKGVMINGKPTGELQVIGNHNGLFDVVIRDADGSVKQTIMKSQPFNQVDNYFRNDKSIIQQRMDRTHADPNIQQTAQPYNGIAWNQ